MLLNQDLTARDAPIANQLREESQALAEIILTEVRIDTL